MQIIRVPELRDAPGVYRVCFETGTNPAEVATAERNADLLGHVFAGPYLLHSPELCRVIVDSSGVAGYLLAVADTSAFASWCETTWWPPLREQYPLGSGIAADAETIGMLHRPPLAPVALLHDYPAHLHIDFLDRARGVGLGRSLIGGLLDQLANLGAPGIHLGVGADNQNAIGFYQHLGFREALVTDGVKWMVRSTT